MLRRREHRTPGQKALPPALQIRRESLRPSVQLPAGGKRKAGFIGLLGKKARIAAAVSATFAPRALQPLGKLDREVGPFPDMAVRLRLVGCLSAQPVELG